MRSNRRSSKQTKLNRKRSISKKNKTRSKRIYFRKLKGGDNELSYSIWKLNYEKWNNFDDYPANHKEANENRQYLNDNFPDYIKMYNKIKLANEETNQPQYRARRILDQIASFRKDLESSTGNATRGIPLTGEPRDRVLQRIQELQKEYDQLMKASAASNPVASNPVESKPALTQPIPRPTISRPAISRPQVASNPVASDKRPNVSLIPIPAAQPVKVQ